MSETERERPRVKLHAPSSQEEVKAAARPGEPREVSREPITTTRYAQLNRFALHSDGSRLALRYTHPNPRQMWILVGLLLCFFGSGLTVPLWAPQHAPVALFAAAGFAFVALIPVAHVYNTRTEPKAVFDRRRGVVSLGAGRTVHERIPLERVRAVQLLRAWEHGFEIRSPDRHVLPWISFQLLLVLDEGRELLVTAGSLEVMQDLAAGVSAYLDVPLLDHSEREGETVHYLEHMRGRPNLPWSIRKAISLKDRHYS